MQLHSDTRKKIDASWDDAERSKFSGGFAGADDFEVKLAGGFDTRRSNQCGVCFEQRSVNGACACM